MVCNIAEIRSNQNKPYPKLLRTKILNWQTVIVQKDTQIQKYSKTILPKSKKKYIFAEIANHYHLENVKKRDTNTTIAANVKMSKNEILSKEFSGEQSAPKKPTPGSIHNECEKLQNAKIDCVQNAKMTNLEFLKV